MTDTPAIQVEPIASRDLRDRLSYYLRLAGEGHLYAVTEKGQKIAILIAAFQGTAPVMEIFDTQLKARFKHALRMARRQDKIVRVKALGIDDVYVMPL